VPPPDETVRTDPETLQQQRLHFLMQFRTPEWNDYMSKHPDLDFKVMNYVAMNASYVDDEAADILQGECLSPSPAKLGCSRSELRRSIERCEKRGHLQVRAPKDPYVSSAQNGRKDGANLVRNRRKPNRLKCLLINTFAWDRAILGANSAQNGRKPDPKVSQVPISKTLKTQERRSRGRVLTDRDPDYSELRMQQLTGSKGW